MSELDLDLQNKIAAASEAVAEESNTRYDWLMAALEYETAGNYAKADECRRNADQLKK
jgi:hypothetical protein